MSLAPFTALAVFTALVLTLALYGLTLAGHFPAEHRAPALKGPVGALCLWTTVVAALVAAGGAAWLAVRVVPLPLAVIGGGGALLFSPLVLRPLPDSIVDGRRGLMGLAALALALAAAGWRLLA